MYFCRVAMALVVYRAAKHLRAICGQIAGAVCREAPMTIHQQNAKEDFSNVL